MGKWREPTFKHGKHSACECEKRWRKFSIEFKWANFIPYTYMSARSWRGAKKIRKIRFPGNGKYTKLIKMENFQTNWGCGMFKKEIQQQRGAPANSDPKDKIGMSTMRTDESEKGAGGRQCVTSALSRIKVKMKFRNFALFWWKTKNSRFEKTRFKGRKEQQQQQIQWIFWISQKFLSFSTHLSMSESISTSPTKRWHKTAAAQWLWKSNRKFVSVFFSPSIALSPP